MQTVFPPSEMIACRPCERSSRRVAVIVGPDDRNTTDPELSLNGLRREISERRWRLGEPGHDEAVQVPRQYMEQARSKSSVDAVLFQPMGLGDASHHRGCARHSEVWARRMACFSYVRVLR